MALVKSAQFQSASAQVMALRLLRASYATWGAMMRSGGSGSSWHLLTHRWSLKVPSLVPSLARCSHLHGHTEIPQHGFLTVPGPRHGCHAAVGMQAFATCISKEKKKFVFSCSSVQGLCPTSSAYGTSCASLWWEGSHKTLCSFLNRQCGLKEQAQGTHTMT